MAHWISRALTSSLLLSAAACVTVAAQPARAQSQARQFNVAAQPANSGIPEFARQADVQILASARATAGKRTNAVRGVMSVQAALDVLLSGTGLMVSSNDGRTIILGVGSARALQSAADGAPAIEEVVVTANKREEAQERVGMSVRALTQENLQKQGADQFSDYYRTVPSLTFQERGPGFNTVSIRGVTSLATSTAGTAGVYYDDMPVNSEQFQSDIKLVDVERVEVLRGPQGTLYGEGSMGGTVKVITNKPDLGRFQAAANGSVSGTAHGGDNYSADGMINVPLAADRAAIRLVAYRRDQSGWIDNVALDQRDANHEITDGGRVSLRLAPSDDLMVMATALYQQQAIGGSQNTDPTYGALSQFRQTVEDSKDRYYQYNLTLHYRLPFADLISSTSYFDRGFTFHRDLQPLADIFGADTSFIDVDRPTRTFTEEVRLSSTSPGRLQYQAGAFYKHQVLSDRETAVLDFAGPTLDFFDSTSSLTLEQKALFGEVSYQAADRLKLTAGLRGVEEHQRIVETSSVLGAPLPDFDGGLTARALTPKFAVDFQIDEDRLLYAVAAEGFRSGGVNPVTGPGVRQTYDPDHLWNYEVGMKGYFLDRRATLNLSAFYIDWRDIQISVPDPNVPGLAFLDNAARAHSIGVEAELSARPIAGLEVGAAIGFDQAILHELSQGGAIIYPRGRLPNVPEIKYSISAEYGHAIAHGLEGYGRVDFAHSGASPNTVSNSFDAPTPVMQKAYSLTNLRFGVRSDRWDLQVFADNLFDKVAELNVDPGLSSPGAPVIAVNRPRTIGLALRSRF